MIAFSVRSISTIIVGLLLMFMSEEVLPLMVRVVGAAFFFPALVSMISVYRNRQNSSPVQNVLVTIVDIGSIAFGLWLLIAPETFLSWVLRMLSIVLFAISSYQLFVLFTSRKFFPLSWKTVTVPLLLALLAIVVFANPFETAYISSIVLGVGIFLAGLSDFIISFRVYRATPTANTELPISR